MGSKKIILENEKTGQEHSQQRIRVTGDNVNRDMGRREERPCLSVVETT